MVEAAPRETGGARAIRFELNDGKAPRLVLEPWNVTIDSPSTTYQGPAMEPVASGDVADC